jgi:hypothetical protein
MTPHASDRTGHLGRATPVVDAVVASGRNESPDLSWEAMRAMGEDAAGSRGWPGSLAAQEALLHIADESAKGVDRDVAMALLQMIPIARLGMRIWKRLRARPECYANANWVEDVAKQAMADLPPDDQYVVMQHLPARQVERVLEAMRHHILEVTIGALEGLAARDATLELTASCLTPFLGHASPRVRLAAIAASRHIRSRRRPPTR